MLIAGSQNLSLVDFPGCLAAVIFTQGCNFRCPYCQNPDLIGRQTKFDFSEEEFTRYLSRRRNMIEGLVITGGEPTIQKDLPEFIRGVKGLGLKVKLDTNGSGPDMLERLFREKLLDYTAIDIKTAFSKYHLVTGMSGAVEKLSSSISLTELSTVPYEFRVTCVPGIVEEDDIPAIGNAIKGARKCCLQQFRPNITYDRKFREVKPYTASRIREFADMLKEYVQEVETRGI